MNPIIKNNAIKQRRKLIESILNTITYASLSEKTNKVLELYIYGDIDLYELEKYFRQIHIS